MSTTIERLVTTLGTLSSNSFDALPPRQRRQLADSMRHWAGIADKGADRRSKRQPQSGVLADLRRGARQD